MAAAVAKRSDPARRTGTAAEARTGAPAAPPTASMATAMAEAVTAAPRLRARAPLVPVCVMGLFSAHFAAN
jgi:hypothetical protein